MKPYFERDGIAIYHGDCREILQELPPESFDMVLTDPPYLVSYSGRWGSDRGLVEGDSDQSWVLPVYRGLWRALKPDGLLIIDAPNIAQIGSDHTAEEWFIDDHLYHFSRRTLARLLEIAGFEIVAGADVRDGENLLFAARKRNEPMRSRARDFAEVDAALTLIDSYVTARVSAQRAA